MQGVLDSSSLSVRAFAPLVMEHAASMVRFRTDSCTLPREMGVIIIGARSSQALKAALRRSMSFAA